MRGSVQGEFPCCAAVKIWHRIGIWVMSAPCADGDHTIVISVGRFIACATCRCQCLRGAPSPQCTIRPGCLRCPGGDCHTKNEWLRIPLSVRRAVALRSNTPQASWRTGVSGACHVSRSRRPRRWWDMCEPFKQFHKMLSLPVASRRWHRHTVVHPAQRGLQALISVAYTWLRKSISLQHHTIHASELGPRGAQRNRH